jgi:hypothetical protein
MKENKRLIALGKEASKNSSDKVAIPLEKTKTLTQLMRLVQEELVGLWKFRVPGKKQTWCTTFYVNGNYYDTYGKLTPEAALESCHKEILKLRKKQKK